MAHFKIECPCCNRSISCRAFLNHVRSSRDNKHADLLRAFDDRRCAMSSEVRTCETCSQVLEARGFTINEAMMAHFDLDVRIPRKCSSCARVPWNAGLTKDTNSSIAKISTDRMGAENPIHKVLSDKSSRESWIASLKAGRKEFDQFRAGKTLEEAFGIERAATTRKSLSHAAKLRTVHGHAGCTHSDETKRKIGIATAKRLSESKCKTTKPQRLLFDALTASNDIGYVLEHAFEFFIIDIAVPSLKLAIEVDGDFYHVNENLGYSPDHQVQKVNIANDRRKNAFLAKCGWRVLRF